MNISSAGDFSNTIADMASDMKAGNLQLDITMAIFKQIQDSQQQQAAALINMMKQTQSLTGTGRVVDVSA
jgi:hypothetical protein